ncbi:MAG TPA: GMC family oxidoreductase [Moraxellaceae bacterium]|nr:GMC family oxidoreductase [Moraxellaceae bacterium]
MNRSNLHHVATAHAFIEAMFPAGTVLPAPDSTQLLSEVETWCQQQGGLGRGLDALLTLLDARFFLTHRQRFAAAPLAERQRFLESLTGLQGGLLHGLSAPFRMAQLQDEGLLARLHLPNGVRVPANIESARWRQQISGPDQLEGDDTIEADVVIIGTGAGGAAAALELASQGLAVVVLEEGRYHDRRDFTGRLTEMIPLLYRAMGLTAAIGNTVIPIPIGRNVGGTTTINSGTAMAVPPETLARWRASGLRGFTESEMAPYNAEVMDILQVQNADPRFVGEIGNVIKEGANRIGFVQTHDLPRNAVGCDGQGLCQFGCPTDAKQSTNVSYVPRALDAGAFLFTGFKATELIKQGQRIEGVKAEGRTSDGKVRRLTVRARATIVSMGSFLSPVFLMRNGIKLPQLGRQLSIHPCGVALGYFPNRTFDHARRIPQGFGVADLAREGLMFECGTIPLLAHGMMSSLAGSAYTRFVENYPHTAYFGFMIRDTSRGRVRPGPHPDFPLITYWMNNTDLSLFKRGIRELSRMYLAAGAEEVMIPGLRHMAVARNENEVDKYLAKARSPRDFTISAYHPLGTCQMGVNEKFGVTDASLQVFGTEGLYVMDGSSVPGPLGVNPQVTIMALATRGARQLGKKLA